MKILVIIVIVLAIIAFAQIMKVYSLSNKLRNKDEADITKDETKFNAAMLIIFMIAFLGIKVLVFSNPNTSHLFAESPFLELSKAVCVA